MIEVEKMKSLSWKKSIRIVMLLLPGLYSMAATAVAPNGQFACQVTAEEGQIGLVVVLANTKEAAEKAAVGAKAYTTEGQIRLATTVLQCIEQGEERFADYQFQQFYEQVPR
jgi:hypothetical protein